MADYSAKDLAVTIDTSQWDALVAGLNYKEIRKGYRAALRSSGNVLKKAIWSNISSSVSTPRFLNASDDVKVKIFSKLGGYIVILPVRRITKKHAVTARWIATGTGVRATNNGYNRGKIEAKPLFKTAVEANINPAINEIMGALEKRFRKIGEKARLAK